MVSFIKYDLDGGNEILIEVSDTTDVGEVINAGAISSVIKSAKSTFDYALNSAYLSVLQMQKKFNEFKADEVEVSFGLTATGEFGNNVFAISKSGVEANYLVKMKWVKKVNPTIDDNIRKVKKSLNEKKER
jgi:hypothetical protein